MALRLITTQLLHIIYHWNAGVVILRTVVIIPFIRGLFWQENKFTDGPLSLSALARIPVRKTLNYVDLVHCYANRLLLRVCPVSGARLHGPLLFSTLSPLSAGEIEPRQLGPLLRVPTVHYWLACYIAHMHMVHSYSKTNGVGAKLNNELCQHGLFPSPCVHCRTLSELPRRCHQRGSSK